MRKHGVWSMEYGVWRVLSFFLLLTPYFLLPAPASASVILGSSVNLNALSSGLVGYWPLDGATTNWATNKTNDISGNNNTGTLISMSTTTSPVTGKIGQALKFNGSQYIYNFSSQISPVGSSRTVCAWFNTTSTSREGIIGTRSSATGGGFVFTLNDGGAGKLTYFHTGASSFTISAGITTGKWYHACAVFNSPASLISLYLNGVLIGGPSGFSTTENATAFNGIIGDEDQTLGDSFRGIIDDVRIYNRALSPQEIALLYAAGQAHVETANTVSLSSGLVAYWPLDGSTINWNAKRVSDISGSGKTGTMIGFNTATTTASVAGKIGGALKFDGASDYISADLTSLGTLTNGTMSVWIKRTSVTASLVIEGNGSKPSFEGTNPLSLYVNNNCKTDTTTLSVGIWYHLVGTWDGTNARVYVNGALANTTACSSAPTLGSVFTIGARNGAVLPFPGVIDDVRIYNRALSAQEVKDLYALGTANIAHSNTVTLSTGLVGYWTFNGPDINWTKNQVADASGNGNTGTLVSMSTTTSPVAGKIGQALNFDGSTNYVTKVSPTGLPLGSTPRTSAAWIKYTDTSNTYRAITDYGTYNTAQRWGFYLDNTAGAKHVYVSTYADDVASTGVVPADGKWHYAVATYDGVNVVKFYIDGSFDSSKTIGIINTAIGSNPFNIGRGAAEAVSWKGSLDDVRIYNRALSAQEVNQLYLMGK